jgi:hypothetical protein
MMVRHRIAVGLTVAGLVAAGSAPLSGVAQAANLLVKYDTRSTCTVYMNYPKSGVVDNLTWTIPPGHKNIIWRYNVNSTWAAVSDPARAKRQFPWWGFTRQSCIAGAPKRILEGRSNEIASGWRPVSFDVASAPVVAHHHKIKSHATLRDPNNFVIGNVRSTWHVDVTSRTRDRSWVEIYVPNAKQWGYVQANLVR